MIQIQVAEQMKNTFEAFEVQIPFFNRSVGIFDIYRFNQADEIFVIFNYQDFFFA